MRNLRWNMPQPSETRTGFSLIEVLIAMVVLGLGAASLVALFAAGSSTHKRSVDRTRAALVAEQIVNEVRTLYIQGTSPAAVTEKLRQRLPEEIGGYHHDVVAFHPDGEEWSDLELYLEVELRWKQAGKARAETFATILLPRPKRE